jgi:hypothetical protein
MEDQGREEEGKVESGKWKVLSRKTRGGRKKEDRVCEVERIVLED